MKTEIPHIKILLTGALILALLTITLFYWDKSMFSGKNLKSTSTVNDLLGSDLTPIKDFSGVEIESEKYNDKCYLVKVNYNTKSITADIATSRVLESYESGFVFQADSSKYIILNNSNDFQIEVWSLDQDTLKKPIKASGLNSIDWLSSTITDATYVTENRLLVAISYHYRGVKQALYTYDIESHTFSLFSLSEPHAQNNMNMFDVIKISEDQSVIKYFSNTQRQSAEIYHNHNNHIAIFNRKHPNGLEVLKLGIDDGNIEDWYIENKTVFLHTLDNRNIKAPLTRYFSLNLEKLLMAN